VGIAAIVLAVVSRAVIDPIDELVAATERVTAGDLGRPVPVLSSDELASLARSFNQMQAGLAERERLRRELQASRARLVAASDAARRKLERDIHDGAQQQLVSLSVKLGLAEQLVARDPDKALTLLGELKTEAVDAMTNLRDLARGIYPPLLADKGLAEAIGSQARKAAVPTTVLGGDVGRYAPEIEAAVYFCTLEALQNVAKYANASRATVSVERVDGHIAFEITDDGSGFDVDGARHGSGLQGMSDRVEALGGQLDVRSTPGRGTTIAGRVPVTEA
jgi:signal transduction histidine kinase